MPREETRIHALPHLCRANGRATTLRVGDRLVWDPRTSCFSLQRGTETLRFEKQTGNKDNKFLATEFAGKEDGPRRAAELIAVALGCTIEERTLPAGVLEYTLVDEP